MRDMRDQFQSVLNMGPLNQVVSMIPGLNANMIPKGKEKEGTERIKRFLYMMDSMNSEELDGHKPLTESRMVRIAQGSGTRFEEVQVLVEEYKKFQKMVEKMGKLKINNQADMQQMNRNPKQLMQQMGKAIDPKLLKQMGGMGNLMNMMKEMGNMEGMQDMMQQMMGASGGAMGMPPKMPPGMGQRKKR